MKTIRLLLVAILWLASDFVCAFAAKGSPAHHIATYTSFLGFLAFMVLTCRMNNDRVSS